MNEQQQTCCKKVFDIVMHRPVARLFWDISNEVSNEKITRPVTFKFIKEKLDSKMYSSPQNFVNDMRQVFLNGDSYDGEKSIKPHAIALLIDDFEKALARYIPMSSSLEIKLKISIEDFEKILSETVEERPKAERFNAPASTACRLLNSQAKNPVSVNELTKEFLLLRSPKLIMKVIKYIYSLQPEAVRISNGISIAYSLFTEENTQKIHNYILKTIESAAKGTLEASDKDTSVVQQMFEK